MDGTKLSAAAVAARPAAERVKDESPSGPRRHDIRFAAREVSQRGGGTRRGSVSARGTRLAVEPLWASGEPVRQQGAGPEQAEATVSPEQAEATASRCSGPDPGAWSPSG